LSSRGVRDFFHFRSWTKLVYTFPTDEKLWQQYAELRAESLRQGHGGEEATAFYREHRAAMDEGAVVA
jgi:hypothetical protein